MTNLLENGVKSDMAVCGRKQGDRERIAIDPLASLPTRPCEFMFLGLEVKN
jgi:hypothetical protein